MERKELNIMEELILQDIQENPGTSIRGIADRCVKSCRESYIRECVTRLKTLGYVEDRRIKSNCAALYTFADP